MECDILVLISWLSPWGMDPGGSQAASLATAGRALWLPTRLGVEHHRRAIDRCPPLRCHPARRRVIFAAVDTGWPPYDTIIVSSVVIMSLGWTRIGWGRQWNGHRSGPARLQLWSTSMYSNSDSRRSGRRAYIRPASSTLISRRLVSPDTDRLHMGPRSVPSPWDIDNMRRAVWRSSLKLPWKWWNRPWLWTGEGGPYV